MTNKRLAWSVLALLLAINLMNYVDREALYSLLPLIQGDLKLSDAQAGSLASAFVIVYMFAALPIGYWADKGKRVSWMAGGAALWSLATGFSGLAWSYASLFSARAAVGIGESSYGSVSPSFVAEHFPPADHGLVMAIFAMAVSVGSGIGYIAGGLLGQHFGWRSAFYWTAIPGLIFAAMATRLKDPQKNRPAPAAAAPSAPVHSPMSSYLKIFKTPSYSLTTLSMGLMTFALGGFAVWMPSFLHRQWLWSVGKSGSIFGAMTIISGIIGTLAGGWISNWVFKYNSRAYLIVSAAGLIISAPLMIYSLMSSHVMAAMVSLFTAEFFVFLNMGPLNAVLVAVTELKSRSMAFAANIFVIHAIGDALSPTIIGVISDRSNLTIALVFASLFLGASGILCLWAMKYYDADVAAQGGVSAPVYV
ncbi:MAG TPA: MFS transporter [Elusimicrobiota bacterium]|nr:MFS transporter [Elusimicrobiota bacterium]